MLTKLWGAGSLTLAATALPLILSTNPLSASGETTLAADKVQASGQGQREARLGGNPAGGGGSVAGELHPARTKPDRPLTLESFNKLMKAEANLTGVLQRDSNLERSLAMNGNENAIEGWQHRLDMTPAVTQAIKNAGMTTKEYLDAYVSVVRASAVAGLKKEGREVPPSLRQSVPPENVAFVQGHVAQVSAWWNGSSGSVKPNTMEDLYVAPEDSTKTADKKPAKKPARQAGSAKDTQEKAP